MHLSISHWHGSTSPQHLLISHGMARRFPQHLSFSYGMARPPSDILNLAWRGLMPLRRLSFSRGVAWLDVTMTSIRLSLSRDVTWCPCGVSRSLVVRTLLGATPNKMNFKQATSLATTTRPCLLLQLLGHSVDGLHRVGHSAIDNVSTYDYSGTPSTHPWVSNATSGNIINHHNSSMPLMGSLKSILPQTTMSPSTISPAHHRQALMSWSHLHWQRPRLWLLGHTTVIPDLNHH